MHLIYFLEGGPTAVTPDTLARYGLSHIRTVGGIQPKQCLKGPDGLSGVLVAAGDVPISDIHYRPEEQTWAFSIPPIPDPVEANNPAATKCSARRWAVGYSRASGSPGPDDLARAKQLDGRFVTLADGRPWLIPMARQWFRADALDPPLAWSHVLPRTLQLTPEGKWEPGEVVSKYRSLWDKAVAYETAIHAALANVAANAVSVTFDFDSMGFVCEALSHNYHVSPVEISLLGLLDTTIVQSIIDVITDRETLDRISREIHEARAKKADRQEQTLGCGPGLIPAEQDNSTDTMTVTP